MITKRPSNRTVQEGQGAEFACEGQASPRNVSVRWFKDGKDIKTMADLVSLRRGWEDIRRRCGLARRPRMGGRAHARATPPTNLLCVAGSFLLMIMY